MLTIDEYERLKRKLSKGKFYPYGLLPQLGEEFGLREAYLLEVEGFEPTVLKVGVGSAMLVEVGCVLSIDSPLLPEFYDWGPKEDPRWVEVERLFPITAHDFIEKTGIPWSKFDNYSFYLEPELQPDGSFRCDPKERRKVEKAWMRSSQDGAKTRVFIDELMRVVETCALNGAELGILENWGQTAEGQLKILDFGDVEEGGIARAQAQFSNQTLKNRLMR